MSNIVIGPYQDHQRRTCIVIGHNKTSVELIALDTSSGLKVSEMQEKSFQKDFKFIDGYPLHKAIEQYIEFAVYSGMTEQVKDIFHDMLTSPGIDVDTSLAVSKLETVKTLAPGTKVAKVKNIKRKSSDEDDNPPWEDSPSSKASKKVTGKVHSEKRSKAQDETSEIQSTTNEVKKGMSSNGTKKVAAPATQKNSDGIKVGKRTAAQMFRELILSNSYDDDAIFSMVQKEFGLGDNKRSYVTYYRRELKRKGLL